MLVPLLTAEFLLPNDLSLVVTSPYDFLVIREETSADNYKHDEKTIESLGHSCQTANNGKDCLEMIRKKGTTLC